MIILIIHNHYLLRGGEDEVVQSEVNMLRHFGHKVVFYVRSNTEFESFRLFKKIKTVLMDVFWSKDSYQAVRGIIQRERPDIVHVHNTFFLVSPSIYDACMVENVPVVQTLHNYRLLCPIGTFYRDGKICNDCLTKGLKSSVINKCWKGSRIATLLLASIVKLIRWKRIFFRKVRRSIVLGEFSRKMFSTNGIPSNFISVKPNFLDFDPGTSSVQGTYALFIGALRDYKGIKTLVRAWRNVNDHFPLKMIGEGPLRGEMEKLMQDASIGLLGQKTLAEVIGYIRGALFVVVPSECYETCARVIVESFACGVPVLASDHGAMKELITDHETGVFFTANDAEDLAVKANYLISHTDLVNKMGVNARIEFKKRYTMEMNHTQLMDIYKSIAIERSRGEEEDVVSEMSAH